MGHYTVLDPRPEGPELVYAVNERACLPSGYSRAELAGIPRDALFFADDTDLRRAVQERSRTGSFTGDLKTASLRIKRFAGLAARPRCCSNRPLGCAVQE